MAVTTLSPSYSGDDQRGAFERTPPQDLAAEQSVLGGVLLSKDAIADVVEVLNPYDFYRPAHSLVYEAALDLYSRGEPVDPVSVAAELTRAGTLAKVGGASYLHTLVASVPTAANAGYYARIVAEKAILRRLVEAGTRVVQLGYAGGVGGDVDNAVDRAQAEIYAVSERRSGEDYVALSELLNPTLEEIEAIAGREGGMSGVPTGIADLDRLTNGLHAGQLVIVAARPGLGKALALDTQLPTPTGWTTMGEVQVGDRLIGADGKPTTVVAATDVMIDRPCFAVTFSDGTTIVADAEHQWRTQTRASRRKAQLDRVSRSTGSEVRTTAELARTVHCATKDRRLNHSVENTAPVQLDDAELLIAPYTLGVWLGDGHSASARFTTADPEIAMLVEADGFVVTPRGNLLHSIGLPEKPPIAARECVVCGATFVPQTTQVRTCGRRCGGAARGTRALPAPTCVRCGGAAVTGFGYCADCHATHGSVGARLRWIGVLNDKHIPTAYLRASEEQRRALLAGLLDTDGTVMPSGNVQFAVTSRRLAEDFVELITSLGYGCGVHEKGVRGRSEMTSTCYVVTFTTTDDVFRLERKTLAHKERNRSDGSRTGLRFITDVRPVASVPVRCVQVDNADHMYLASRAMIPTHNSTLALDFARAASIKHSLASVVFSLEMSKSEITMRLLSAEARVHLQHMRTGHMTDDDWARLARRMGEVSSAPLFIDDSPHLTMTEIRAKTRRLKQRHDLRLVVVDYMQLLSSPHKVESRQQEVSEISRSMKLLAKELEVPVVALSQLNRLSEQRADKRPMLSDLRESGCLPASTRIWRADTGAEVTIGELYAKGERDIAVWSMNRRMQMVGRTMSHVFSTGIKEVFRLRLASGRTLDATANHPLYTYDGWRDLGTIKVGERIAVPRSTPEPLDAVAWPEHEVVLLAHMLGDGSMVDLPAPHRLTHGRRNPIAAWLDGLGLWDKRSHEKFVPDGVFGLPNEQLGLFLRHLWSTDGSLRIGKTGDVSIYYASTSRRLVDDVARLLTRFGITARIKTVRKVGHREGYHLHVVGSEQQAAFLQRIGCHGARGELVAKALDIVTGVVANPNVDTVPRAVWDHVRAVLHEQKVPHREFAMATASKGPTQFCGSTTWKHSPSRARLARVAAILGDADLEMLATNDVFWDEIVAVESLGEQEVFDATVPGEHNFVADGVIVHNSLEQDADIVILLHRDDMYEKESARAGEADLIVAKHRNGPTDTVTVAFQGHYSRFVDMTAAPTPAPGPGFG